MILKKQPTTFISPRLFADDNSLITTGKDLNDWQQFMNGYAQTD